jgi:hypothetical protein
MLFLEIKLVADAPLRTEPNSLRIASIFALFTAFRFACSGLSLEEA